MTVNTLGTINVFEAALAAGIKRVVFASSQNVFGTQEYYDENFPDHPALISEDEVSHPTIIYGATKQMNEFLANWYYENHGLETIGMRYTLVFGFARMRGNGNQTINLINLPAEGKKGTVEWADTVPNWVYIEDVATANILAADCDYPKKNRFLTIGGEQKSFPELKEYVLSVLPDAEIELLPGVFPACYNLDMSAAEREIGYKAQYTTEEGIHETINLIRKKEGLPAV